MSLTSDDLADIKQLMGSLLSAQEKRLDERFNKIDKRLDKMDERFDKMDERFEGIDVKLDEIMNAVGSDLNEPRTTNCAPRAKSGLTRGPLF